MSDKDYEELKKREAEAYSAYDKADESRRKAGDAWLPLKRQLDREEMRRSVVAEMKGGGNP